MSEQDELVQSIATAGTADLRTLIDDMACSLGMNVGEVLAVGPFLSRAWIAGAKAFQTEMLARRIEAGDDVRPFAEGDEGGAG